MDDQPKQVQIKASDEDLKGRYANVMYIVHNKEEFVFDFLSVFPPLGQLVSRVVVSPSHMKRIVNVIKENMDKYEEQYGEIEESKQPEAIGFYPNK